MTKFNSWFQKNFMVFVYIIASAMLLINILSMYSVFTTFRTSNDECIWQPVKEKNGKVSFYFTNVKQGGASWEAGIRDGDRLSKINGEVILKTAQAQDIINKLAEGSIAKYTIIRGKSEFTTDVVIKKLVDVGALSFGLLATIWFIVSFLVLMAKPDGYLQRLFFLLGILFTIIRSYPMMMPYLPEGGYRAVFIVFYTLYVAVSSAFPFFYMRFFALFPEQSGSGFRKWTDWVIGLFGMNAFLLSMYGYLFIEGRFFTEFTNPQLHTLSFGRASYISSSFSTFAFIAGFYIILTRYYKLKTVVEKKRIRLIVYSYGLGLLGMGFVSIIAPNLGYIVYNSPEYFTPIVLVVFLPIAFAISIFKYNLMDVSIVVKNAIFYGTATVLLAILYFLVVLGLGNAIGAMMPQSYQNIVSLFFFVLFAIVFQSKKDNFQDLLTRKFYPEQHAYRKVLSGFNQELAEIVGKENILDALDNLMIREIKVQKSAILLRDGAENQYTLARAHNIALDESFNIKRSLVTKALQLKKNAKTEPVFTQDQFRDIVSNRAEELINAGIYTIVPLHCGNHLPGFLLLGLKRSGSQFGGKDLTLLASLSSQVAISLENARLYEAEAEKIELEKELDVARKIQQNLLPKTLPQNKKVDIYGTMIPAQHIGGDYFDVIELDENRFYVAVGDVSGKGLAASLYMAQVQTLVQSECRLADNPKDVLIEVNRKLAASMDKHSFITMSLAFFDLNKQLVTFCRAGHVPLLIKSGDKVAEIKTQGMGLGLSKSNLFNKTLLQDEFALEHGQLFMFLSDGVSEAMNGKNECIGMQKIVEIVQNANGAGAEAMVRNTLDAVHTHRADTDPNDDITLVVLKYIG